MILCRIVDCIERGVWVARSAYLVASLAAAALLPVSLPASAQAVPSSTHASSAPPVLVSEGIGRGVLTLDGPWQFHLGDDASWALPGIDDATGHGGWEQITADTTWGAQGHPAYAGYAWYRRHVNIRSRSEVDSSLTILVPHIDDVYEIYWNGKPLGHDGKFPPHPVYYNKGPLTFSVGPLGEGVIAFRVWKYPMLALDSDQLGGFNATPLLGIPTAIASAKAASELEWLRDNQITFLEDLLYAVATIVCLLGLMRDRSQILLLWMAFLCFSQLANDYSFKMRHSFPTAIVAGLDQPCISLSDIGLWFLLLYLFKLNDNPRFARLTGYLAVSTFVIQWLLGFLLMLDWSDPRFTLTYQITEFGLTCIIQLLEIYPFVLLYWAVRSRQNLGLTRWLLALTALVSYTSLFLSLASLNGYRFTHFTLAQRMTKPLFLFWETLSIASRSKALYFLWLHSLRCTGIRWILRGDINLWRWSSRVRGRCSIFSCQMSRS